MDSGRELSFLNTSVLAGSVEIAKISPELDNALKFRFKTDGDAEKTIEAIKNTAKSDPSTFKSVPVVLYSSLDGKTVELEVNCTVDATKKAEAKSKVLETAYLSNTSKLHYRNRKYSPTEN